jgi:hypothetical protein
MRFQKWLFMAKELCGDACRRRSGFYFAVLLILVFAFLLSYEVTVQNLNGANMLFVFILNLVSAMILMSVIAWGEVRYIFRDASKKKN